MYRWSPYRKRYVWTPYYKLPCYYHYYDYLTRPYNYRNRYSKYRLPYQYYYNSPYYYCRSKYPYYWYYYRPYNRYRKYFDDTYYDLKTRMDLFKSFLKNLPKNRSEMVNHLEIPDDLFKNRPYEDVELESLPSGTVTPQSYSGDEPNERPGSGCSTSSDISLSRALTDSEIDYDMYKRVQHRNLSDPFQDMRSVLRAFPDEYLVKVNSFQQANPPKDPARPPDPPTPTRPLHNDDLYRRLRRAYDDNNLRVFVPDDPALLELDEALQSLDFEALDLDTI